MSNPGKRFHPFSEEPEPQPKKLVDVGDGRPNVKRSCVADLFKGFHSLLLVDLPIHSAANADP
jgi:hypothetical protein